MPQPQTDASEFFRKGTQKDNEVGVFVFGGCALKAGGILPFEFLGVMEKHYPHADVYFYIDRNRIWYHQGIDGISLNVAGTGEYLAEKVQQYKKSVFLGGSAGGYAAMLFAGLARADYCIAFNPQTDLDDCESNPEIAAKYDFTKADRDYMDVTQWLRGNTQYYIFARDTGDSDWIHRRHQTRRLIPMNKHNIFLQSINAGMKELRDNGRLMKILDRFI